MIFIASPGWIVTGSEARTALDDAGHQSLIQQDQTRVFDTFFNKFSTVLFWPWDLSIRPVVGCKHSINLYPMRSKPVWRFETSAFKGTASIPAPVATFLSAHQRAWILLGLISYPVSDINVTLFWLFLDSNDCYLRVSGGNPITSRRMLYSRIIFVWISPFVKTL